PVRLIAVAAPVTTAVTPAVAAAVATAIIAAPLLLAPGLASLRPAPIAAGLSAELGLPIGTRTPALSLGRSGIPDYRQYGPQGQSRSQHFSPSHLRNENTLPRKRATRVPGRVRVPLALPVQLPGQRDLQCTGR